MAYSMGFTQEEVRQLSLYAPIVDDAAMAILCRVTYESKISNYRVTHETRVLVEEPGLRNSVIDAQRNAYEKSLAYIRKRLPTIRQMEKAAKRLIGEPANWESPTRLIQIGGEREWKNFTL